MSGLLYHNTLEEQNFNLRMQVSKLQVALQKAKESRASDLRLESEADRLRDQVDTLQQALASASEGEQVLENELRETRELVKDLEIENTRLHALLADHLQRQGCSYPGTTGQAVIDGQAALALGSSGTPTTAASRGLDQAASVRASSEEAGTRVATSPRSENTGVVGAAQEDPDCYLHGPESQWERADIPRTSDANWEQAALPNRSLGPPKASKLAGEKAGIPSPQAALPGVDDGPGARVDWREAPATRPSWLERMQAAATAAARRHSQGEEVHGDSSATEALRGGSAVVGDGGSPPFAERSDNGIRRKPHPPPLEVSRFQRRLNSAMQQRRHETTTRADIPGSQLAAQQIQSGSLNPGSAEGHLEPAHPYNEDLRPSAFGESADASLCREMREASPLAPKSFGVSMRASVLPRDRDEDDLRLCWSSPAAASRTSGAGSMRSEHGSGSDYRSVQPVPQGHDELIEEQRSREYLEVLRVLEQGLAKAPFKHRDTLHAKQDKAMVRQSRPQVLQLTSPAPHHASRCPQVPESKARRVVAPKVRRGQTAPQQANPGHVHASGSLQNTAGVANSLGDVCALDSRWDNAPAGNANGTMDTMSNTDRAGRATADRIPALLGAWSKSAGSTETLVGTTDELRRSNRETRIGSGQPSGPSQGVATELPLHVPSPDGPSPGRMAFDTSRSETTIRDSWDTFQVQGQKGEEAGADAKALASHDLTCKQCITSRELDYLCNEIRLLEIKLSEAELQLATPTDDGAISSVSSEQQHKRSLRQQYRRRHQELQALKQEALAAMAKQHESLAAVGTLADWAAPAPPPPLSLDITNVMKSTRRRGAKSKVQRSEGTENAALAGNNAAAAGTHDILEPAVRSKSARRKRSTHQEKIASRLAKGLPSKPLCKELGRSSAPVNPSSMSLLPHHNIYFPGASGRDSLKQRRKVVFVNL